METNGPRIARYKRFYICPGKSFAIIVTLYFLFTQSFPFTQGVNQKYIFLAHILFSDDLLCHKR